MSDHREALRERIVCQLADAIDSREIEVEDAVAIAKSVMCIMISLFPPEVRRLMSETVAATIAAQTEQLNKDREQARTPKRSFH